MAEMIKENKINDVENSQSRESYLQQATEEGTILEVTILDFEPNICANPFEAIEYIEEMFNEHGNGISMGSFISDIVIKGSIEIIANIWAYLLSRWEGDTITHVNEECDIDYEVGSSLYY